MIAKFAYPEASRSEILRFIPESARTVLDIGCASGAFGAALKAQRPHVIVTGVEPDEDAANRAAARLDFVHVGLFPDMPPAPPHGGYDCIVLNDVIEHVEDPLPLLEAAAGVCAAGGRLVASIPNVRCARAVWDLVVRGDWTYRDQGILDRTHLRFYTRSTIRKLFESNGWQVQLLSGINQPGSRRAPAVGKLVAAALRDFAYPQFVVVATPARREQ